MKKTKQENNFRSFIVVIGIFGLILGFCFWFVHIKEARCAKHCYSMGAKEYNYQGFSGYSWRMRDMPQQMLKQDACTCLYK